MNPLWVIWVAFLLTQPVLAVMAVQLGPSEGDGALVLPLLAVSVFEAIASVAIGRVVGPRVEPTRSVLRWAFAESIGLLGLVVRIASGPTLVAPAMMLAAFVLILAQPPRTE